MGSIKTRQIGMGYTPLQARPSCGNCAHSAVAGSDGAVAVCYWRDERGIVCNVGAFFVTPYATCTQHKPKPRMPATPEDYR